MEEELRRLIKENMEYMTEYGVVFNALSFEPDTIGCYFDTADGYFKVYSNEGSRHFTWLKDRNKDKAYRELYLMVKSQIVCEKERIGV